MIESRKVVAAAILFGLALLVVGLVVAPFAASARASSGRADEVAGDRIGAAFASISDRTPDAALAAAAARLSKGDRAISANCVGAVWPDIDRGCLSRADGAPAPHVRTVTIGYQADQNTTVLVRVPTSEITQR